MILQNYKRVECFGDWGFGSCEPREAGRAAQTVRKMMVGWCESIFTPWVGYLRPMWSAFDIKGMGGIGYGKALPFVPVEESREEEGKGHAEIVGGEGAKGEEKFYRCFWRKLRA